MLGEFLTNFKDEAIDLLRNKKNLVNLLILGVLVLGLPIGIKIIQEQQILRSRAAGDPIVFKGANVAFRNNEWVALKPQISLELLSPFETAAGAASSSNTSSNTSSSSPSPSPSTSTTGSTGAGCSGNTCTDCIINNRSDILPFYKTNGWDTTCSGQGKVVTDWCSKVDSSGCQSLKSGSCASACSTTTFVPVSTSVWQSFADANTFRDFIFQGFGFTTEAKNLITANSTIEVKDLQNACNGGGGWMPGDKKVVLNCTQYEAAIHELSHVWWHAYRLRNPDMAKGLAKDVVRLSNGDGPTAAVSFAKDYVNGIGSWKGMYCTDNGCADPQNIKDSDFDLIEAATNAKINDWEIYAGFASWTMGKYKDGPRALPDYAWKYFEPEFKGLIAEKSYYEGGHP